MRGSRAVRIVDREGHRIEEARVSAATTARALTAQYAGALQEGERLEVLVAGAVVPDEDAVYPHVVTEEARGVPSPVHVTVRIARPIARARFL